MKTTSIIIPPYSVNPNRPVLFVYDFANEQYVSFTVETNQQETDHHYVRKYDQGLKLCTTRAVQTYQVRMFESTDTNGEYDVILEDMEVPHKRRRRHDVDDENDLFSSAFGSDIDSFENTFLTTLNHEQQENEVKSLKEENKWLTCMVQALQADMREKNEIQQNILKTCVQLTRDMEEMKKQCFQKKSD